MTDNKSPSQAVCVGLACMTKPESFWSFFIFCRLKTSHTEGSFSKCYQHIARGLYETKQKPIKNSLFCFKGTTGDFVLFLKNSDFITSLQLKKLLNSSHVHHSHGMRVLTPPPNSSYQLTPPPSTVTVPIYLHTPPPLPYPAV